MAAYVTILRTAYVTILRKLISQSFYNRALPKSNLKSGSTLDEEVHL